MRIFIALDIPGEIRARLAEYVQRVRSYASEARWARVEGLHVTLKFVGEIKDTKLDEIKSALGNIKAAPFEVTFSSIGFFPNAKSPRSFWIGVQGGRFLTDLATAIDTALLRVGIESEGRKYQPHLTLARSGKKAGTLKLLATVIDQESQTQFGRMLANEFFLFKSQLGRGGSLYTKLQQFSLSEQAS